LQLLPDFHHSNLGPQLHEPKMAEWLGEDVCELSFGLDKLQNNLSSIDKTSVDVIAVVVEDWILCKGDGGLIVHHQGWRVSFLTSQLAQQPAQPNSLACRRGSCDVLRLTRSHVDSATIFCFNDCQAVRAAPRKTSTPEVLHRPSMLPAMSASLKTVSSGSPSSVLGGASLKIVSLSPPLPPRLGKMIA